MAYGTEYKKDFIYMKVTKDCFEIPLAMADSVAELAEKVGTHRTTIHRALNKKGSGYVRVEVDKCNDIELAEEAIMKKMRLFIVEAECEFEKNGKSGEWAHLQGIIQGLRIALFQCIKIGE